MGINFTCLDHVICSNRSAMRSIYLWLRNETLQGTREIKAESRSLKGESSRKKEKDTWILQSSLLMNGRMHCDLYNNRSNATGHHFVIIQRILTFLSVSKSPYPYRYINSYSPIGMYIPIAPERVLEEEKCRWRMKNDETKRGSIFSPPKCVLGL